MARVSAAMPPFALVRFPRHHPGDGGGEPDVFVRDEEIRQEQRQQ